MANEKVSQMTSLTAAEIAGEDLFLITDMSARESKRLSAADMLWYIQTTGSFNASTAITAATASYLSLSGRDITVSSASYAKTASWAINAIDSINSDTASLAETASYVDLSGMGISEVDTASFLKHTIGVNNGTASYSLTSSFVNLAKTSSFLLHTLGVNNGTSSYSISSSAALTASYALSAKTASYSISGSYVLTSSFAHSALTASYNLGNGIVSFQSVRSNTRMTGTGGAPESPFAITGLEVKVLPKSVNSNFLIISSIVTGQGSSTGDTSIALWKSSSLSVGALIKTIASMDCNDGDALSLATSYIDSPGSPITPVTYSGQVYNDSGGSWYINRSRNNNYWGTSSLTVIEFLS